LANQIEMKKYLADKNYKVKARIHSDACNSGSQFTSIITGDKFGCEATNVIPTYVENSDEQMRLDSYLLVAERAHQIILEKIKESDDEELQMFKSLMEKPSLGGVHSAYEKWYNDVRSFGFGKKSLYIV